jgi:Arc/MetJ-type ribon-helix-helix transcriptional regulator
MVKTQVQLPEDDLAALRRLAAEQGVSVSELVRRGVKQFLASSRGPSREELWRRATEAAGKFRSGYHDVARRHDEYLAEAYAEGLRSPKPKASDGGADAS